MRMWDSERKTERRRFRVLGTILFFYCMFVYILLGIEIPNGFFLSLLNVFYTHFYKDCLFNSVLVNLLTVISGLCAVKEFKCVGLC